MSNAIIIAPKEVEQKFRQDVARLNYQAILQSVHDIQFTRENVHEDLRIFFEVIFYYFSRFLHNSLYRSFLFQKLIFS